MSPHNISLCLSAGRPSLTESLLYRALIHKRSHHFLQCSISIRTQLPLRLHNEVKAKNRFHRESSHMETCTKIMKAGAFSRLCWYFTESLSVSLKVYEQGEWLLTKCLPWKTGCWNSGLWIILYPCSEHCGQLMQQSRAQKTLRYAPRGGGVKSPSRANQFSYYQEMKQLRKKQMIELPGTFFSIG